jgi:16S rRNA A1518/A1519 N6-dimethyltransferase RsmA/KsgA/DIM1 with predicted DNA glycosylase/AP lyase activity
MDIVHKFKETDFKPIPKARIILASFIRKTNPDISFNDMKLYLDFISYLFNKKSKLLFEKTEKLFSDKQKEIIKKTLKVEDDYLFTSLSYENIVYLFNTFNKYASDRSKKIVEGFYKEKEDNNPHKNFSTKNKW